MVDQIRDFGPVYGFWSFTIERLNKVLKSYRTNNRNGGELEVTFLREFFRDVRLRELVTSCATDASSDHQIQAASRLILASESDTRGTVASLSKEVDDRFQEYDGKVSFFLM